MSLNLGVNTSSCDLICYSATGSVWIVQTRSPKNAKGPLYWATAETWRTPSEDTKGPSKATKTQGFSFPGDYSLMKAKC